MKNWAGYQFLHQGHLLKPLDTDKTLVILGFRRDIKMWSVEVLPSFIVSVPRAMDLDSCLLPVSLELLVLVAFMALC